MGNHSSGDAAIPHVGDGSLQRWGKDLSGAAPAADHVKKLYARAEAAAQEWRDSFGRMTDRGENELPASAKVTAEMQALRTRSGGATSSGDWGSISADAEALPKVYEMEHETDEARLRQPRKSHEAEKRADVTVAAQDN